MKHVAQIGAIVFALFVLPGVVANAEALAPSAFRTINPNEFKPITVTAPWRPVRVDEPSRYSLVVRDPFESLRHQRPAKKAKVKHVEAIAKVVNKVKKKKATGNTAAVVKRFGSSRNVRGLATWYCKAGRSVCHHSYPDRRGFDLYAAAGSEIRIGNWRGRTVGVCRQDGLPVLNPYTGKKVKCLPVKLVDWCACKSTRIIDLYWDAFNVMNVRGEGGGVRVRVTW